MRDDYWVFYSHGVLEAKKKAYPKKQAPVFHSNDKEKKLSPFDTSRTAQKLSCFLLFYTLLFPVFTDKKCFPHTVIASIGELD